MSDDWTEVGIAPTEMIQKIESLRVEVCDLRAELEEHARVTASSLLALERRIIELLGHVRPSRTLPFDHDHAHIRATNRAIRKQIPVPLAVVHSDSVQY